MGLEGATRPPAYLSPQWCTALSLWLALPTLGYSLIFVPLLWVIQHDRTATRLARLRLELEEVSRRDITCQNSGSATAGRPIPPLGSEPFPAL
jgi:hypothetical protein